MGYMTEAKKFTWVDAGITLGGLYFIEEAFFDIVYPNGLLMDAIELVVGAYLLWSRIDKFSKK